MPRYAAYGLLIESDIGIPWFLDDRSPDETCVFVRRLPSLGRGTFTTTIGRHERDRSVIRYKGTCELEVLSGAEIRVAAEVGVDDDEIASYVAGVGLGILQHQLGRLVLHASAVRSLAGAVAFLGGSQWGKSTTAAALSVHGWTLVTDDVAAFVRDSDGHLTLVSSFPFLRLWPDSLRAIGLDPVLYPPMYPGTQKRRVRADAGFEAGTNELAAMYLLGEGPRVEVVEVGGHEAFAELVRHSFAVRVLEDAGPQAWHLQLAAELVRETRIRRLLAPREGAGVIDGIVSAITGDLAEIASSSA